MKITLENTDNLTPILQAAEKKAKVRRYPIDAIKNTMRDFQTNLDALLLKKDQIGAILESRSFGGKMPNSYKGVPEVTQITLRLVKKDTFEVLSVERVRMTTTWETIRMSSEQLDCAKKFTTKHISPIR